MTILSRAKLVLMGRTQYVPTFREKYNKKSSMQNHHQETQENNSEVLHPKKGRNVEHTTTKKSLRQKGRLDILGKGIEVYTDREIARKNHFVGFEVFTSISN